MRDYNDNCTWRVPAVLAFWSSRCRALTYGVDGENCLFGTHHLRTATRDFAPQTAVNRSSHGLTRDTTRPSPRPSPDSSFHPRCPRRPPRSPPHDPRVFSPPQGRERWCVIGDFSRRARGVGHVLTNYAGPRLQGQTLSIPGAHGSLGGWCWGVCMSDCACSHGQDDATGRKWQVPVRRVGDARMEDK